MSKLYTSLLHAKLLLNGGELRAMTPIPEKYHDIIDPEFTIGLGALREVEGKGLQCPMRGCGKWYHKLGDHLTKAHGDGSAKDVKRMLQIQPTASLVSRGLSERLSDAARRRYERGDNPFIDCQGRQRNKTRRLKELAAARVRAHKTTSDNSWLAGHRNLTNTCEAQIAHRLVDLRNRLGRSPSIAEADAMDHGLYTACLRIYGTWNNAKRAIGMEVLKEHEYDREDVIAMLGDYYKVNGTFPRWKQVERKNTHPLLPSAGTISKKFPGKLWPEIMDHMAWKIGVTDGRYGKPEYAKKALVADVESAA